MVAAPEADAAPRGSGGLVVLPYFAGERTPIFDPSARGVIAGLHLGHDRGQLYRSLLEATAFAVRHNVETMVEAGDAIANGTLTARVKAALLADPDVKGLQIDVDSNDGVVTLSGALDRAANVERAQALARGVEGVKSVENRLTVKPPG